MPSAHPTGPPSRRFAGDLARAFQFYAIAVGLCFAVAMASPVLGDRSLIAAMFTPAAAVLLMSVLTGRDGRAESGALSLGLWRAGFPSWGLAIAVPCLVLGFAYGAVWLGGIAAFVAPDCAANPARIAADLLASIALVTVTAAVAEEIGWRGYLLPRLMTFGALRASLLTGLLHGLWHLPVLLLTPLYHGGGPRLVTVPLFVLTLTMAGVCYGYLRLSSASVWPAALAHATFNVVWERLNSVTAATSPQALELLAGESGILTLAALTAAAAFFARCLREPPFGGNLLERSGPGSEAVAS